MRPVLDAERSITEDECRARTERVKAFAGERGLAAVVAFSAPRASMWNQTGHVGYISNWSNLDRNCESAVVVPVDGDPVLLYTGLPALIPQITQVSWLTDVRVAASGWSPPPRCPWASTAAWLGRWGMRSQTTSRTSSPVFGP